MEGWEGGGGGLLKVGVMLEDVIMKAMYCDPCGEGGSSPENYIRVSP